MKNVDPDDPGPDAADPLTSDQRATPNADLDQWRYSDHLIDGMWSPGWVAVNVYHERMRAHHVKAERAWHGDHPTPAKLHTAFARTYADVIVAIEHLTAAGTLP